jgi:hypothetical protein
MSHCLVLCQVKEFHSVLTLVQKGPFQPFLDSLFKEVVVLWLYGGASLSKDITDEAI